MASYGYAYEIVGDVAQNLKCPVCKSLIKDCIELPCAHTMCKLCMEYICKEAEDSEMDAVCPTCQTIFIIEWVKESKAIDRMITTSVIIKCPKVHVGCEWQGDIISVQEHKDECTFKTTECPNSGCSAEILCPDIQAHLDICEYRTEKCLYCLEENQLNLMEEHYKTCKFYPILCPNEECGSKMIRQELTGHLENVCEYQEVQCEFSDAGCTHKILRKEMKSHFDENINDHVTLLLQSNKTLEKAHEDTRRDLADARAVLAESSVVLKEFNERLIETKRELDETKAELAEFKKKQIEVDLTIGEDKQSNVNEKVQRKSQPNGEENANNERKSSSSNLILPGPGTKPRRKNIIPDNLSAPKSPMIQSKSPVLQGKVQRSESSASSSSGSSDISAPEKVSPKGVSPIPIKKNGLPEEGANKGIIDRMRRQGEITPIVTGPTFVLQSIMNMLHNAHQNHYPQHFNALMSNMEADQFYIVNGSILAKINTNGCLRRYDVIYIQPWEERQKNLFLDMRHNRRTKHQSGRVSIEVNNNVAILKLLVNCTLDDTVASVICTQKNTSFLPSYLKDWGWGFNVPTGQHRGTFFAKKEHILIRLNKRQNSTDQNLSGI